MQYFVASSSLKGKNLSSVVFSGIHGHTWLLNYEGCSYIEG